MQLMSNRTSHFVRLGLLAVMAAGVVVPGCRAIDRIKLWLNPSDEIELTGEPAVRVDPVEVSASARDRAPERLGLEVRMMVVDDTGYDAPRLLSELESVGNAEIDDQTRSSWERWGFRMIEVPLEQLDPLLDALTPIQPLSVQWMGEFGNWRPLIRAGAIPKTRVRVGESTYPLDAGRPRLIARSWIEPTLSSDDVFGALRLDLGMQIESSRQDAVRLVPEQGRARLEDEGMVIDDLLGSLTLSGRNAIVIIGEVPGYDWSRLPQPAPESQSVDDGDNGAVGPGTDEAGSEAKNASDDAAETSVRAIRPVRSGGTIEPTPPSLRSLGELMLIGRGSRIVRPNETRTLPKRVLVVLIPHAGGQFRLITMNSADARVRP